MTPTPRPRRPECYRNTQTLRSAPPARVRRVTTASGVAAADFAVPTRSAARPGAGAHEEHHCVYSARCRSRGPTPVSGARRHSAMTSTAAVSGFSCPGAPCGASSRHLPIRDKQSWKETFPTSLARKRRKSLGGGHHKDATPRHPRGWRCPAAPESDRTLGLVIWHAFWHPITPKSFRAPSSDQLVELAASGCQSPRPRRTRRLSSRHLWGPSTGPQKRVFRSFP